jgi:hypothetical protein
MSKTDRIPSFAMSPQELHQRGLAGTGFAIDPVASVTMSQPLDEIAPWSAG